MTTQPTHPRPPNIAYRSNRKAPCGRSPATPSDCQDHVHTRREVQSRAHSAHLVDRRPQEYARDDHAARDLEVCTVLTPDSTTASMPRTEKTIDSTTTLTMGHERRGQASQRVTRGLVVLLSSVNRLALPDRQRFCVKTTTRDLSALFSRSRVEVVSSRYTQIFRSHPIQSTSATAPRYARHFPRSSG